MNSIEELKSRIKELEKENQELRKLLNKEKNKPGRKPKLQDHEIEAMKCYRYQNKTYKEIAELFNCSPGLVHKVLNKG
ncbi:hypothetical protein WS9_009990 [Paraclostridium sordellii 8483]|uniref:hypothetical protein n=1 Tax=Paraclostridium sordellii TaxID=1505 RepID=UPI00030DB549|nr:hypothetical protein [Paeniclostridium sordellii]TAN66634.1 hypothetical protein WS9_009990 [Paeniclostridium sordellii 8483]